MTEPISVSPEFAAEAEQDPDPVSRWSLQAPGIDVFWPILAAVLTAIVIVVASVAHSSMAAVGAGAPRTDWSPLPTPSADAPFVVVQVSSFPTRKEGQGEAQKLRRSGLDAGVLRSDFYEPLNEGWYVVYVGPFEATAEGRAQAETITQEIEGSIVRTLHRR